MPALGAPLEPSPSAKLMAAVSQTGMSSDEAYYYLDSHDALKAHELAGRLRRLAEAYEIFRSERMRGPAEGIRLAADLIDPDKAQS